MANLYDMLKEDHNTVKRMLDQTITSKNASLYPQIKRKLEVHMSGEEKFLYPRLMEKDKETALESYEEHHVGKLILKELDETDSNNEAWIPKVKVLKDVLDHHIMEEESQIFPQAQQILNTSEEEQIKTKLLELKSQR